MANSIDELFYQYAKQQEAEAKASSSSHSGSFQRNFEDVKYTGLVPGKATVVRAIDGPPGSGVTPYTARVVNISRVVCDDGKVMRLIRPSFDQDPNYIINKIISKVKQTKWVNDASGKGTKTYPILESNPDIYNIIDKNGLASDDKRAKFDKGWVGKEVLMMNVIDRSKMDWHKTNKHTMLLAKSVTESNGVEYADEGISNFAVKERIVHLFKSYGSWEKYDLAITRTGNLNNPYIISNASIAPMEVDEDVRGFISTEAGLTEEEQGWEKYNLDNLFRITTATKIYNRLKGTIKRIDGALGTNFLEELQEEVEKEKKLFAELYKDEDNNTTAPKAEAPVVESVTALAAEEVKPAPTRARTTSSSAPGSDLPYYNTLSDEMKTKIISATKGLDGVWDIKWDPSVGEVVACPTCKAVAPYEGITHCPVCGLEF